MGKNWRLGTVSSRLTAGNPGSPRIWHEYCLSFLLPASCSGTAIQYQLNYCDLEAILINSDFVCLVLPLSAETHHLISDQQLSLMKPSTILINAGRGAVVDETALINALLNKTIYAAGLDVYAQETLSTSSKLIILPM